MKPNNGSGMAIASLVLGIVSLVGVLFPGCALPAGVIGLALGIVSLRSPRRGMAIAGVVLSVLGLVAGVTWLVVQWKLIQSPGFYEWLDKYLM